MNRACNDEDEEDKMARFLGGLNRQLTHQVDRQTYFDMQKLLHLAVNLLIKWIYKRTLDKFLGGLNRQLAHQVDRQAYLGNLRKKNQGPQIQKTKKPLNLPRYNVLITQVISFGMWEALDVGFQTTSLRM